MKLKRAIQVMTVAILLIGSLHPQMALAWHSRARVGVYLGPVYGGGWSYGYPGFYGYSGFYGYPGYGFYGYPYYPPAVVTVRPAAPPVYIEQPPVAPVENTGYWYYCRNPQGYYPTVQECQDKWQKVAPLPEQ